MMRTQKRHDAPEETPPIATLWAVVSLRGGLALSDVCSDRASARRLCDEWNGENGAPRTFRVVAYDLRVPR